MLAIDDTVELGRLLMVIAAFMRDESCGQCVPCRVGTVRQEEALARLLSGHTRGSVQDELALIAEIGQAMRDASICGLGQTASSAIESAIERLGVFTHDAAHGQPHDRRPAGRGPRGLDDPRGVRSSSGSTRRRSATATRCSPPTSAASAWSRSRAARVLAPACSRKVEHDMVVKTDSERVRHSRKMVMEFLGSSVDLSITPAGAGLPARATTRTRRATGRRRRRTPSATAAAPATTRSPTGRPPPPCTSPVKVDNDLYVRDYSKCILCYKCVDACGDQWQNTFAITVAGRGFDARISTEYANPLPDSACVYCGNCIAVCPTGALMFASEHELREAAQWDESRQTQADTICPYCGVGCNLTLHVQDNQIVKVSSPDDHDITRGNLCIKGRFGFQHVQSPAADARAEPEVTEG